MMRAMLQLISLTLPLSMRFAMPLMSISMVMVYYDFVDRWILRSFAQFCSSLVLVSCVSRLLERRNIVSLGSIGDITEDVVDDTAVNTAGDAAGESR